MDVKAQIENAISNCDREMERLAKISQSMYKGSMKPGESVPNWGRFSIAADDTLAASRKKHAQDTCRAAIYAAIDAEAAKVRQTMSKPASVDDIRSVEFALSRNNLTADEVAALHERYAGNYQLARAIEERAHELGFDIPTTAISAADVEAAKSKVGVMFRQYERGNTPMPPEVWADSIMGAFDHVDALGRPY